MRPHRRQPTRLPRPWDSPGKNTGVGCHFLLQCMKVNTESEVVQSYPTLSDPMVCSPPGSPVRGIFQARVLEWGAIAFSEWELVDVISQGSPQVHDWGPVCPCFKILQGGHPLHKSDSFFLKNIYFYYFFGCTSSQWQHRASSIFAAACRVFSCGRQDLVPWPGTEPQIPCIGSMESQPKNCKGSTSQTLSS